MSAHMLGILDECIPASWAEADAQAAQELDPVLAPTPEGIALADILLDLGSVGRPMLESSTRYLLGDRIAEWLQIPRHPGQDELVRRGWAPFVAFREAGLALPLAPQGYRLFDELLRQGALFSLSEGRPIAIEIPEGNRERYEAGDRSSGTSS